jgi:hypothetical protein
VWLSLLNDWASVRILGGDVQGIEARLRTEERQLHIVRPELARTFRGTLADLLVSEGRGDEAREIYQALWDSNPKRQRAGARLAGVR